MKGNHNKARAWNWDDKDVSVIVSEGNHNIWSAYRSPATDVSNIISKGNHNQFEDGVLYGVNVSIIVS